MNRFTKTGVSFPSMLIGAGEYRPQRFEYGTESWRAEVMRHVAIMCEFSPDSSVNVSEDQKRALMAIVAAAIDEGSCRANLMKALGKLGINWVDRARQEDLDAQKDLRRLQLKSRVIEDFNQWFKAGMDLKLQSAGPGSRVHGALDNHLVIPSSLGIADLDWMALAEGKAMVFLIQHDWAELVKSVPSDEGEWRLPADECCFEFRISGRTFCLILHCDDGIPTTGEVIYEAPGKGWLLLAAGPVEGGDIISPHHYEAGHFSFLMQQVRAVAITLDAQVTETETVRADYKRNQTRERSDQSKPLDYHVLSIARRSRATRLEPDSDREIHHRRCHFRRGHWRHYSNHKTWINWMLVGDLSLGFVDKDYAL